MKTVQWCWKESKMYYVRYIKLLYHFWYVLVLVIFCMALLFSSFQLVLCSCIKIWVKKKLWNMTIIIFIYFCLLLMQGDQWWTCSICFVYQGQRWPTWFQKHVWQTTILWSDGWAFEGMLQECICVFIIKCWQWYYKA